ncbi:MAG TPA: general secretion pathway protein GspB [Rudaea sp.]
MSLILEALKKSEAKRRLGEAPDIGTPFTLARRRSSPLLPLIAFAVLVLGALAWWFLRTPQNAAPAIAAAPSTVVAPKPAAANPAPAPAPVRSGTFANVNPGTGAAPARVAPHTMPAKAASNPSAPVAANVPAPANTPATATAPPAAAATATPPAAATPAPTAAMPAPALAMTKPAAPITDNKPVPAAPSKDVPPSTRPADDPLSPEHAGQKKNPPPPDDAAVAKAEPKKDAPAAPPAPMYYELDYRLRKDLPAMNIAMHVYAKDPAQRFVIINGDHFAEGDTVKDDLTLKQILPDGLLMEFRGQRFFYPRSSH